MLLFSATFHIKAGADKQIIVIEIAKDANNSVKGWTQETWWQSDWKAHGKAGVADRIKDKYKTDNYKTKVIKSGYRFILYTKKSKSGKRTIHISSTKNSEIHASDKKRVSELAKKYPGQYEFHEKNGFNEKVIREPVKDKAHEFELSPAKTVPAWPDDINETIACEKGSGISHYSVKELKKGVVVFRGHTTDKNNKKGSTVILNATDWLKTGLSDLRLEKKWHDEVDKAVKDICKVSKTKFSTSRKAVSFLQGNLKNYLENLQRIKKEECQQGKHLLSECVFKKTHPVSTGSGR